MAAARWHSVWLVLCVGNCHDHDVMHASLIQELLFASAALLPVALLLVRLLVGM
jgi:hypothetical protein